VSRKDPQFNVRLAPDREVILRAAAFVHGKDTPGELARELIEEAIDRYAKLPAVKKALEARTEQTAANEGKLSHLPRDRAGSATRTRGKGSP
jgi:hypothetical protein